LWSAETEEATRERVNARRRDGIVGGAGMRGRMQRVVNECEALRAMDQPATASGVRVEGASVVKESKG